jgi:MGT family glycosyltransferase
MAKVAVVNLPYWGHVLPTLPLVRELVRRGDEVVYFAEPRFHVALRAAGATAEPLAIAPPVSFPSQPQEQLEWILGTIAPAVETLLPRIERLRPAWLMYGIACPWGKCLAELSGRPAAALGGPMLLPPERIERRFGAAWTSPAVVALRDSILRRFGWRAACGDLLINRAEINVIFTSRDFQPDAERFGDDYIFVGPAVDSRAPVAAASSQPVPEEAVYVSMGTLSEDDSELLAACIDGCASTGRPVLVSTGGKPPDPSLASPPSGVSVAEWVDQASVLRRAALFVSHGGFNGVNEACWFGVPLLLLPRRADQPAVARRIAELGAGLVLRREEVSAGAVRRGAAAVLSDPSFRRASMAIGETLRRAGGAAAAADAIARAFGRAA